MVIGQGKMMEKTKWKKGEIQERKWKIYNIDMKVRET